MKKNAFLREFLPIERFFMISTLAIFAVLYLCTCYSDVLITANHSLKLWDALLGGDILRFYELNQDAVLVCGPHNIPNPACYDFIIYVIFAIWVFPIWLFGKLFGLYALDTVLGTLWAKSISLPFLAATMFYMCKIAKLRPGYSTKMLVWILYLFLTSIYTVAYVAVIGQYDLITLAFILAGIYAYLQDNDKLFLALFSISIPIKAFSLLVFFPLLIYKQKNLPKILLNLVLVIIPMVLSRIIIPMSSQSNISLLFPQLMSYELHAGYGGALFFAVYAAFCILCYISPYCEDPEQRINWVMYIGLLSFALFLFSCKVFPYWYLYITPFVFLIMLSKNSLLSINTLLETVFSFFTVLSQMIIYDRCFSSVICGNTLLTVLFSKDKIHAAGMNAILHKFMSSDYIDVLNKISASFAVAAFLMFCVINYPKHEERKYAIIDRTSVYVVQVIRFMLAVGVCIVPIVCYIYTR